MPRQSNVNVSTSAKNSQVFGKMAQQLEKMQDDNLTTKHFTPWDIDQLSIAEDAIRILKKSEQTKNALEENALESRAKDSYDNVKADDSTDHDSQGHYQSQFDETSTKSPDSTMATPETSESKKVATKAK
jgi:hypothetical protein